jgi:hypothetical protein
MKKVFFSFITLSTLGYSSEPGFSFTSDPLLFKPLVANTFEPRMGLLWHNNDNRLRLDIGNSVDLVQYTFDVIKKHVTLGSDFFTYTLLSGEKNFHFPVDAVDYLFGFNANFVDTLNSGILSSRFRLSHISAHFVDGHFDGTLKTWKNGLSPRVYSREFLDLTIAYTPINSFRGYIGIIYLWHVDPTSLPTLSGYIGGEFHHQLLTIFNGFAAYQFSATGLRPRHEVHCGIKIGDWNGRGTQLFFIYHTGNSIHGEYYDQKDEYSGFGFNVDF